jgi:hypothetical protein
MPLNDASTSSLTHVGIFRPRMMGCSRSKLSSSSEKAPWCAGAAAAFGAGDGGAALAAAFGAIYLFSLCRSIFCEEMFLRFLLWMVFVWMIMTYLFTAKQEDYKFVLLVAMV